MLSRNFRLQNVGDISWLKKNYDYDSIAYSIDELIVLNVERNEKNIGLFSSTLKDLLSQYFMPVAAGGGIRSLEDAQRIMDSGVDKLVLNTSFFTKPSLIKQLVKIYGTQCVVASLDYKYSGLEETSVFIKNGSEKIDMDVLTAVKHIESLGAGELYLTSINDDGTGEGYDLKTLHDIISQVRIPIIASGGCGRLDQFVQAYAIGASAAATSDLFNFMADGLTEARSHILDSGTPMAEWEISFFERYKTNI
jgi:cyclase